jgi:hypothetical protein
MSKKGQHLQRQKTFAIRNRIMLYFMRSRLRPVITSVHTVLPKYVICLQRLCIPSPPFNNCKSVGSISIWSIFKSAAQGVDMYYSVNYKLTLVAAPSWLLPLIAKEVIHHRNEQRILNPRQAVDTPEWASGYMPPYSNRYVSMNRV